MQRSPQDCSSHPALERVAPQQSRRYGLQDPGGPDSRLEVPRDYCLGDVENSAGQAAPEDGKEG